MIPHHLPCASRAPVAVVRCASLKHSGVARFPDPARHKGNRPHDRVHVHPIHCRPVGSAKPIKPLCAQRTGKSRKRRKPPATRAKPKEYTPVESENNRLQSPHQRIRGSLKSNWQHTFPIDTTNPRGFLPERCSNAGHSQTKPKPHTLARIRKSSSIKTLAAASMKDRYSNWVRNA